MKPNIKSTSELSANGVRGIVYGPGGAGKTRLALTCPSTLIVSVDGGLDSLEGSDIDTIEPSSYAETRDVVKWFATSEEARHYETLFVDDLTELADKLLVELLPKHKHGQQAYGELEMTIKALIRGIRDNMPGRNVILTAKLDEVQDETKSIKYGPLMPGRALTRWLPHALPFTFALHDGKIQTSACSKWTAKARSGKLQPLEEPNIGEIIRKVTRGD